MIERIRKIIKIEETLGKKWGANTRFAKKISVSTGLVGDWLSGKSEPGKYYRDIICREYGISRDWLDTGAGEMMRPVGNPDQPPSPVTEPNAGSAPQRQGHHTVGVNGMIELAEMRGERNAWKEAHQQVVRETAVAMERYRNTIERVEQLILFGGKMGAMAQDFAARKKATLEKKAPHEQAV